MNITYSKTERILEGAFVGDMTAQDARKITNLQDAWNFILDEDVIKRKSDYTILSQINKYVETSFSYFSGYPRFFWD